MDGEPMVKILTYNIWFNFVNDKRMDEILKVILKADADFICLQEVTEASREAILLNPMIREKYLNVGGTASANNFLGEYGTMIISRYPCLYFEKYFKSQMGRTLLIAEPQLPMNLIVATAHYESLGQSAWIRKQQLLESFKLIKAAEKESRKFHSVIVGDFNFD